MFTLLAVSQTHSQSGLYSSKAALCHQILFIIVTDRISRHSQAAEGVGFSGLRILSLVFADDVVLLASLNSYLQLALGQFAAE